MFVFYLYDFLIKFPLFRLTICVRDLVWAFVRSSCPFIHSVRPSVHARSSDHTTDSDPIWSPWITGASWSTFQYRGSSLRRVPSRSRLIFGYDVLTLSAAFFVTPILLWFDNLMAECCSGLVSASADFYICLWTRICLSSVSPPQACIYYRWASTTTFGSSCSALSSPLVSIRSSSLYNQMPRHPCTDTTAS